MLTGVAIQVPTSSNPMDRHRTSFQIRGNASAHAGRQCWTAMLDGNAGRQCICACAVPHPLLLQRVWHRCITITAGLMGEEVGDPSQKISMSQSHRQRNIHQSHI